MGKEWITKKPKWITKKENKPEWITKKEKKQNWITKKEEEPPKMGNPAVVEIYEDARENAMINRGIPAMNTGGDVVVGKGGDYIKDLID